MPSSDSPNASTSTKALTFAAYASFVPIGIATVLLGPMLPTLSARWSLNYSQAGALFTAQYLASTLAVALSGVLVSRWGFRFAIKTGLLLMSAGVGLLLTGPKVMGIFCIGAYGGGLGLAVPAANLLVAEVNPKRRSATLNLLNFCWSAGAVACPFLVALAVKSHEVTLFLGAVAGFALVMAIGIAAMPASIIEPSAKKDVAQKTGPAIPWGHGALLMLACAVLSLRWRGERFRGMGRVLREKSGEPVAGDGSDDSVVFLCGDAPRESFSADVVTAG